MAWVPAAPLVAAIRTAKQFLTFVTSGPIRYAIAFCKKQHVLTDAANRLRTAFGPSGAPGAPAAADA